MATRSEIVLETNERITAILESPEGLRNPSAARELALRSTMDVSAAVATLARLPAESPFHERMEREGPVGVTSAANAGADITGKATDRETRLAQLSKVAAVYNRDKGYHRREG